MGIVDGEQQRPLPGQIDTQPVQTMHCRELALDRRISAEIQDRLSQGGGPLKDAGAFPLAEGSDRRLEELAHDPEGVLTFELAPHR